MYPKDSCSEFCFQNENERAEYEQAIRKVAKDTPLDDWAAFAKATKLKAALLKKCAHISLKKTPLQTCRGEPDPDLRDTEIVPFTYDGGIEAFIRNEVLPYAPDAC